jgi:hypothetical protein
MSGSGGDTGYDYQADVNAYVAAFGLAGQPLPWFEGYYDVPIAWAAETGGPGDDMKIITLQNRTIEVQAKHGLVRGAEYVATFRRLVTGLRNSADLRCALIVDRHASAVIRSDLKHDIARLGQGRSDSLKTITTELLADLGESTQTVSEVFARLRVIVVDLDEGSDGVSAAQSLLSRVVAPGKAIISYDLLGKRYHRSIKRRGQDTVHSCARYLEGSVGLAASTSLPAAVTTRYANYTRRITESFYSPGLQVRFEIENAWNRVVPLVKTPSSLKAQIERYQEWTRLTRNQSFDESVEAELFSETNLHSVIVGGPGSGKTTVSRKMAHDLSDSSLVVWVRLPVVSGLMAHGATFDDALARIAVDGSEFSEQQGRMIVASAGMLVADGLDECDPNRTSIAEAILRWTVSHPGARVCVLTRPVGHSPELLPNFSHAELVPLDTGGVREMAALMISRKVNPSQQAERLSTFLSVVDKEKTVAAVAARNPLLLSFLVSLFIDGQPIGGSRAMLFSRIIEQIRKAPPRKQIAPPMAVDYALSWRAAEMVGWSSLEKPDRSVADLYEFIGNELASGFEGVRAAEAAINEWIEHGLLEKLTAGSLDAVVFVHLALGEYLAGRYLARLSEDKFRVVLTGFRNKAKWREPILFSAAAGAGEHVIATLLDLDRPDKPHSTEAMLAAAALEQSEPLSLPTPLIKRLIENLKQRLPSTIPMVAIDAAASLLAISRIAPDFVAAAGQEYWSHEQEWTRFAARCVAIGSRSTLIGIADVANWLNEFEPRHSFSFGTQAQGAWPAGTHDLQKAALAAAVTRIANDLPFDDAKFRIVAFIKSKDISISMSEAIRDELQGEPFEAVVQEAQREEQEASISQFQYMFEIYEQSKRAQQRAMELLITACGAPRDVNMKCRCGYKSLGSLFSSMEFWDATAGDFGSAAFAERALVEVLRGWIAGLNLNPATLAQESNCFINSGSPLLKLPRIKRELNAERVWAANINIPLLGEAMQQRSWFLAVSAAQLFAVTDSPDRGQTLDALLEAEKNKSLRFVGYFANSVWGSVAFQKLLNKISKPAGDQSGFLYAGLLQCARNPSERGAAIVASLNAVRSNYPAGAVRAAEALMQCSADDLATHEAEIRELFRYWEKRGSWCERCRKPVHGTSCDDCHVVPPEPQKQLVALLAKAGALSFEELIELADRESFGVAEEARKALVERARTSPQHMKDLLAKVGSGAANQRVLDDILALPVDELRRVADQLRELLRCNSAPARARIVRSLAAGWLDSRDADAFAHSALSDESPQVRNSAATVLRELTQL